MNTDRVDTTRAAIIDVRLKPGRRQICGALHYYPQQLLTTERLLLPHAMNEPIAVYGDSELLVAAVVEKLRRSGYRGTIGLERWEDSGLPLEDTDGLGAVV